MNKNVLYVIQLIVLTLSISLFFSCKQKTKNLKNTNIEAKSDIEFQSEIGELTSENVQKFLQKNAVSKNYNGFFNYGDGVWLQVYNIKGFKVSDIEWLKKYIPSISSFITVVELKNTPELVYLFPDSKRIDFYNYESQVQELDLSTVPSQCENLICKDYKLLNLNSISKLQTLKAIDFKCTLHEFKQVKNENLKYIGIELNPEEDFDCEDVLKFPNLEELHIYACSEIKNISSLKYLNLKKIQIFQEEKLNMYQDELNDLKKNLNNLIIYSN